MPTYAYAERPRCPVWVYLAFAVVPAVVLSALVVVIAVVSHAHTLWSSLVVVLTISAGFGFLPRFSQRVVMVDSHGVRIGRSRIPFDAVTSMRPVSGQELKRLRHEIADAGQVSSGLAGSWPLLGSLALGLNMMLMGARLMATEDRRNGMRCSPWQEPALYVETPGLKTERWLIAARDPLALEEAVGRAQAVTATRPDPAHVDLASEIPDVSADLPRIADEGWLPPPRER